MGAYFLLVILITPFVTADNLGNGHFSYITTSTPVMVTIVSFTCLMIIPSLRTYFDNNVPALRKVILIGTFIPLVCYLAWDMVIMGVVPLQGTPGLQEMLHSSTSNSDLVSALTSLLQRDTITILAKFFTSICMATSFLSVSLCLSDFLSDGLSIPKKGKGSALIFVMTFLPPVMIVLFYPNAFINGLKYAGISCFVLMVLLPPLMVWRGRYHKQLALAGATGAGFRVPGGKGLLALLVIFATVMIGLSVEHII